MESDGSESDVGDAPKLQIKTTCGPGGVLEQGMPPLRGQVLIS